METLMPDPVIFPVAVQHSSPRMVYSTPVARREKLRELGVDEEILVAAVQFGLTEKLTQVMFDPKTAGGYDMYKYMTRLLRMKLYEQGWKLFDGNNIAMIREPNSGVSIVVCAGDGQTGSTFGKPPKSKRSKGDVFLDISRMIAVDLFGHDVIETRRVAPDDAKTWLLLHYHVVVGSQHFLRAELSRPAEAERGVITDWYDRIILNVPLPGSIADDETADDQGPVIIPSITVNL